jgi:serine/threonine protein kinase
VIGELIAGKYRVEGELGQGGMGAVYRARIVRNARPVAIKVLRAEIVGQSQFESRFEAEVLVTSRVHHDNIVEVLDHGYLDDGRLYLVLELLTGRSLGEVMQASDSIEWQRALRITREVALALGAVHAEGVVHRDIKPENIFLLPEKGGESVKLMDFGLAKTLVAEEEEDAELTQPGFAIGTPTYMAPERVTGDYDFRSDLYGLAVVAYHMFVGKPPFEGDPTDILKDHLTREPVPPSEANPKAGIPPTVESMLTRALAKDMDRRFQTADELVRAIDLVLVGEDDNTLFSPEAPEWSRWERLRHWLSPVLDGSKQTRLIAGLSAALFLVVLSSILILIFRGDSKNDPVATAAPSVTETRASDEVSPHAVESAVVERLASIEVALAAHGFVATEGTPRVLPGARLCDEGEADGLQVHACVFASAEGASGARSQVEPDEEVATSVIVANDDAILWIVDESAVDPEGRRIQQIVESFLSVE